MTILRHASARRLATHGPGWMQTTCLLLAATAQSSLSMRAAVRLTARWSQWWIHCWVTLSSWRVTPPKERTTSSLSRHEAGLIWFVNIWRRTFISCTAAWESYRFGISRRGAPGETPGTASQLSFLKTAANESLVDPWG